MLFEEDWYGAYSTCLSCGYVYEFGAGEEFVAVEGEGATLDGNPIEMPSGDGLEVVAIEASKPERVQVASEALAGRAYRIRAPGSIAVSACYVAAGRFDGMFSTRDCRSVDVAAAQLVVREAGGSLSFGDELSKTSLSLDARYGIAAARTDTNLERASALWRLRRAVRILPAAAILRKSAAVTA